MATPPRRNPTDTLRRSTLLALAGPGALIDTPKMSLLMAGLDHWLGKEYAQQLEEPRLAAVMRRMNHGQPLGLRVPPTPKDEEDAKGVAAWQFPEWFVSQEADPTLLSLGQRARALVNRKQYNEVPASQRKRYVPMRFVAACPNGHLQDVGWSAVVHGTGPACSPVNLSLVELGVAGDLADLSVRCGGCQKGVVLATLVGRGTERVDEDEPLDVEKNPLGMCGGHQPWLGADVREQCVDRDSDTGGPYRLRLLVRHASNAYFPNALRVISIPAPQGQNVTLVERLRHLPQATQTILLGLPNLATLTQFRPIIAATMQGFETVSDEQLFEAIQKLGGGLELTAPVIPSYPKDEELAAFYAVPESLDRRIDDPDFTAYAFPMSRLPDATASVAGKTVHVRDFVERVVLIDRLREVQTLMGFMRIEPPAELIRSEYDLNPRMAKITLAENWRPAIELRGEGVFVGLDTAKVAAWLERDAIASHIERVRAELVKSRYGKKAQSTLDVSRVTTTELPYILVHTLAHLVLIGVALECGYAASSIRERIYVGEVDGVQRYGFLLYTGTADSGGTLGGLVEVGRSITRHIASGLELGALCSNDPICAEARHPVADGGHIHGAACHGCVLVAESSCERRNELLDRRLLVETVGSDASLAFFGPRGTS